MSREQTPSRSRLTLFGAVAPNRECRRKKVENHLAIHLALCPNSMLGQDGHLDTTSSHIYIYNLPSSCPLGKLGKMEGESILPFFRHLALEGKLRASCKPLYLQGLMSSCPTCPSCPCVCGGNIFRLNIVTNGAEHHLLLPDALVRLQLVPTHRVGTSERGARKKENCPCVITGTFSPSFLRRARSGMIGAQYSGGRFGFPVFLGEGKRKVSP